ncbi:hypothetical protein [Aquimarina megaterium]|uniref:hypothetical protein n=1 Tax=Aquimarina megaterium TaxID=1443666 RepID=UPI0004AFB2A1|nr:hypothetical protein [Aquimarina megaterium]
MRDFSIEFATEKIHSSRTKEYFNEVVKSYYGNSYRSAIVMLYSIVITDLLYKLQDLKDIYADEKAIKILDEIEELKEKNPKSPDWEKKLVNWVFERTNLLEPADESNLNSLQSLRNLCAHPVLLSDGYDLYQPNKETTRAHIRNALEGVLTKPPILSKNIFHDFLDNLSRIKSMIDIDNEEDLKKHLFSRYFKKFNSKVENSVFKSLWRIVFKTTDEKSQENRKINFKALKLMIDNNFKKYQNIILEEKDYYSDFNEKLIVLYIRLLNYYPEFFDILTDSAKVLIQSVTRKNADLETYAWFISGDIRTHLLNIIKYRKDWNREYDYAHISAQTIMEVAEYARSNGDIEEANLFLIEMFGESSNYNEADNRYNMLILPNLDKFSEEDFKILLKRIDKNGQIYNRRDASHTIGQIKNKINSRFDDFDFSGYISF